MIKFIHSTIRVGEPVFVSGTHIRNGEDHEDPAGIIFMDLSFLTMRAALSNIHLSLKNESLRLDVSRSSNYQSQPEILECYASETGQTGQRGIANVSSGRLTCTIDFDPVDTHPKNEIPSNIRVVRLAIVIKLGERPFYRRLTIECTARQIASTLSNHSNHSYAKTIQVDYRPDLSHCPYFVDIIKELRVVAGRRGDLDEIWGSGFDRADEIGQTLFMWALSDKRKSLATVLLNRGERRLDEKDATGRTPLSWAAGNGYRDITSKLLGLTTDVGQHSADRDDQTPLDWAIQNDHRDVVRILLEDPKSADRDLEELLTLVVKNDQVRIAVVLINTLLQRRDDPQEWLSTRLDEAIKKGYRSLVEATIDCRADVDSMRNEKTPLCRAIACDNLSAVKLLIERGANIEQKAKNGETPLSTAIKGGKEEIVRLLLEEDVNIEESLINQAARYSTIWRMVFEKKKNGNLAKTPDDLDSSIDGEFKARVMIFNSNSGVYGRNSEDIPINSLLRYSTAYSIPPNDNSSFQWIHLPANNMKWVEVFIFHFTDRSSAYNILKPPRWVERQHRGKPNAHHARFMQPFCQGFDPIAPPNPLKSGQTHRDQNIVMFMPYFHWEEETRLSETRSVIRNLTTTGQTKYQKLHGAYTSQDQSHSLHMRRTLDQFCYYTLDDTDKRDQNQTVSRYQRNNSSSSKVAVVVDQLWLWVLVGSTGRADTILTCFPSNDDFNPIARTGLDPDPDGFTDVLENIMLQRIYEPQTMKTPYDLAGVIASRCSKVFLDPSRAGGNLQFAEIYQRAINDVVEQETELFDIFSTLIEFRRDKADTAKKIRDALLTLQGMRDQDARHLRDVRHLRDLCLDYSQDTDHSEIPSRDEINSLANSLYPDKEKVFALLQRLGNLHVLEISREITLIREIKDVQDELNIMTMVFNDQRSVIKEMEKIIVERANLVTRNSLSQIRIDSEEKAKTDQVGDNQDFNVRDEESEDVSDTKAPILIKENPPIRTDENSNESHQERASHSRSEVWGTSLDAKYPSLPVSAVQASVDEVAEMTRRAANALQALEFLVDLKQKQSNVVDARSARIQAQESLKLTKASEEQGRAIMVFTIATIVFLPLSFMAAFFALNITEFQRDQGGTLGLGYVLAIMLPISFVISAFLIYIALKATSLQSMMTMITGWF